MLHRTPSRDTVTTRVMVVVAHPDDETFGCGSLLLLAAERGAHTVVVCATRGEAGELETGVAAPDGIAALREAELRTAAHALGVAEVEVLDFRDSGMDGEPGPATLCGAPLEQVADAVRASFERHRPDLVITLDGGDGHRDHLRIREVVEQLTAGTATPTYLQCLPRSLMHAWIRHHADDQDAAAYTELPAIGTPDDDLTTVLDTRRHLEARERAIALHRSQRSPFDGLPDDLRHAFLCTEHLIRVNPPWTGGERETDLPLPVTGADPSALAGQLTGSLHHPGTPGYDQAVRAWNVAIPSAPLAVVEAADAADVSAAVRWAASAQVQVAVRCSGHGAVPQSGPVLQVNTGGLQELEISPSGTVRAGAGVRWAQVIEQAAPLGFVPVAGAAPAVGVVGYLTGGGIGPLARTLGVSSDYVTAIDVVTADGVLRRATADENPDLFWGLRGGKGALGIVTAIEFSLVPMTELLGGCLYFDGTDAAHVLTAWRDWTTTLPEAATTSLAIVRLPNAPGVPAPLAGQVAVAVRFAWIGECEEGRRVLAGIATAGRVVFGGVDMMPAAAIRMIHNDPADPMPVTDTSVQLTRLDDAGMDAILAHAGPDAECPQVIVELRHLGGAMTRPRNGASAYSHRDAAYCATTIGIAAPPVVAATKAHARSLMTALAPSGDGTSQPNFGAASDAAELARKYDPPTLARLAALAAHYDPEGVLVESTRAVAAAGHA